MRQWLVNGGRRMSDDAAVGLVAMDGSRERIIHKAKKRFQKRFAMVAGAGVPRGRGRARRRRRLPLRNRGVGAAEGRLGSGEGWGGGQLGARRRGRGADSRAVERRAHAYRSNTCTIAAPPALSLAHDYALCQRRRPAIPLSPPLVASPQPHSQRHGKPRAHPQERVPLW